MTDSPTEHTEGLLRIGEVARLFNLSVGTLRHYEQMGLLDPAHIDPARVPLLRIAAALNSQHHQPPACSRLVARANP